MSIRYRLQQLASTVKAAGLAGKSMTEELAKVASSHDLTAQEIDRVAEIANRDVQLDLYKTASDKRFKFDLARPSEVKEAARKEASVRPRVAADEFDKMASAVDEAGGDPFAAPYRPSIDKLSVLNYQISEADFEKTSADQAEAADREMLFELGIKKAEIEVLATEGKHWEAKTAQDAVLSHKHMAQAAVDMLHNGVTLPSLYEAIYAAVSGATGTTDADRKAADDILMMLLTEAKSRGMRNYQMGFRDQGDPAALEAMSDSQLLEKCKALCSYTADPANRGSIPMRDVKTAEVYIENIYKGSKTPDGKKLMHLGEAAEDAQDDRPSIKDHRVPQMYLDDADNFDKNKPRVINASNEFVVAVKNLVGEQQRLVQLHNAGEYLGLKLKAIEEAIHQLTAVRNAEAEKMKGEAQGIG